MLLCWPCAQSPPTGKYEGANEAMQEAAWGLLQNGMHSGCADGDEAELSHATSS
jgi:hypothetical protein